MTRKSLITRSTPGARRAFSLLELLLVLGVIALLAGLLTNNFDQLIRSLERASPVGHLRELIAEARILAVETGTEHSIRFDADRRQFTLSAIGAPAAAPALQPSNFEPASTTPAPSFPGTTVTFYPLLPQRGFSTGSEPNFGTTATESLQFFPDGSASPARVLIETPGGDPTSLTVDAFSSGPLPVRASGSIF